MKKARFTEEQIIGILREHEAGPPAKLAQDRHGDWIERTKDARRTQT